MTNYVRNAVVVEEAFKVIKEGSGITNIDEIMTSTGTRRPRIRMSELRRERYRSRPRAAHRAYPLDGSDRNEGIPDSI